MSDWIDSDFEMIFREHYRRILRVVRRVLQSDAEAEEVAADVFLRLYRGGPAVTAEGLVGGWLYRTATRAAIDALRANQRRGLEVELDRDGYEAAQPGAGPLDDLLLRERVAAVREVLAGLKVERAQILLLRHGGLSYREIAAAIEINPASVGTMLARAEAEFAAIYKRRQPVQHAAPNQRPQHLKAIPKAMKEER